MSDQQFALVVTAYVFGGFVYFVLNAVAYNHWEQYADKRKYARRVLLTPIWPAVLAFWSWFWFGKVIHDARRSGK